MGDALKSVSINQHFPIEQMDFLETYRKRRGLKSVQEAVRNIVGEKMKETKQ